MKIFLDVGAHTGETVEAVLDPRYGFDRIVCFEPVQSCAQSLRRFGDPRVEVCVFGLWKESCERPVFDPGGLGGSIFADRSRTGQAETCRFVRATDWFREQVGPGDSVWMKLNCEGSECDILEDLVHSGEMDKVAHVMVDFDVRKIPSQRHREAEVRALFGGPRRTRIALREAAMIGDTHAARIRHWLDGAERGVDFSRAPSETAGGLRRAVNRARSAYRAVRRRLFA